MWSFLVALLFWSGRGAGNSDVLVLHSVIRQVSFLHGASCSQPLWHTFGNFGLQDMTRTTLRFVCLLLGLSGLKCPSPKRCFSGLFRVRVRSCFLDAHTDVCSRSRLFRRFHCWAVDRHYVSIVSSTFALCLFDAWNLSVTLFETTSPLYRCFLCVLSEFYVSLPNVSRGSCERPVS